MSTLSNHRTTVTLEADAYAFLNTYAKAKAMKMSEAMNDIIRLAKGKNEAKIIQKGTVWMFDLPPLKDQQTGVSTAMVADLLNQADVDEAV